MLMRRFVFSRRAMRPLEVMRAAEVVRALKRGLRVSRRRPSIRILRSRREGMEDKKPTEMYWVRVVVHGSEVDAKAAKTAARSGEGVGSARSERS